MDKKSKLFPPDSVRNLFNGTDRTYKGDMLHASEVFNASVIAGKEDMKRREENSNQNPVAVSLPPHLFIPSDAQSIDIRNLANVPAGETRDLLTFTAKTGGFTKFIGYGVFFDALMFDLIDMIPLVDGVRVFPFHGNPDRNYKIGLGTGADLSNTNIISCQLDLQPGQQIVWRFTNNDVVDVAAGARMVGYFDQSTIRKAGRFGG